MPNPGTMMHRPLGPGLRLARGRAALLAVSALAASVLAGCANPNFIGVQDYGAVYGNVVDAANKPIGGALVSATGSSSAFRSNGDGSFRIPQISVGTQTVTVSAPGYTLATASVLVVKDVDTSVNNIVLTATTSTPH